MTAVVTFPDISTLTAAQQDRLLRTTAHGVDAGCELLAADLSVLRDLTGYLEPDSGDNVSWNGGNAIHRQCQLTLSTELAWGVALVRVYQVLVDDLTGVAVRRNLGVFCLTAPDSEIGEEVLLDDLTWGQTHTVTGQDRLYLLTRQIGYSYVVTAGTNVLDAIRQVFTDAGLIAVLIDTSASASTVPSDMTWPLVPSSNSDGSDSTFTLPQDVSADGGNDATTWMDVVNDLLALISYRGVWCDENGYYRCTPYADPALRAPTAVFDADDAAQSTVGVGRTVTRDLWKAPNRWIGLWQNMPDDSSGNPTTPTSSNGGVLVLDNPDQGPASIVARGGYPAGVWPSQLQINAATADDFADQVAAQMATDMRTGTTYKVTTAPYPVASHFDVFTYRDQRIPDREVKVQATSWQIGLDGSDVQWEWEQVAP